MRGSKLLKIDTVYRIKFPVLPGGSCHINKTWGRGVDIILDGFYGCKDPSHIPPKCPSIPKSSHRCKAMFSWGWHTQYCINRKQNWPWMILINVQVWSLLPVEWMPLNEGTSSSLTHHLQQHPPTASSMRLLWHWRKEHTMTNHQKEGKIGGIVHFCKQFSKPCNKLQFLKDWNHWWIKKKKNTIEQGQENLGESKKMFSWEKCFWSKRKGFKFLNKINMMMKG